MKQIWKCNKYTLLGLGLILTLIMQAPNSQAQIATWLAYVAPVGGQPHVWLLMESGDKVDLGQGQSPAFSPDGQNVVFDHADQLIGWNGSTTQTLGTGSQPMVSPDGQKLAYVCGGHLCVADVDFNANTLANATQVFTSEAPLLRPAINPAWSNDANDIYFSQQDVLNSPVWLWRLNLSTDSAVKINTAILLHYTDRFLFPTMVDWGKLLFGFESDFTGVGFVEVYDPSTNQTVHLIGNASGLKASQPNCDHSAICLYVRQEAGIRSAWGVDQNGKQQLMAEPPSGFSEPVPAPGLVFPAPQPVEWVGLDFEQPMTRGTWPITATTNVTASLPITFTWARDESQIAEETVSGSEHKLAVQLEYGCQDIVVTATNAAGWATSQDQICIPTPELAYTSQVPTDTILLPGDIITATIWVTTEGEATVRFTPGVDSLEILESSRPYQDNGTPYKTVTFTQTGQMELKMKVLDATYQCGASIDISAVILGLNTWANLSWPTEECPPSFDIYLPLMLNDK